MTLVTPDFHTARCTRYRYRYSECRRCADACPHAAISLTDAGAALDAGRCQNCGLCVSACHTGAWSSATFKPIDLLRQAIKLPGWRVGCAPSGAEAGKTVDTVVPCLGALDGVTLAYLAKRRIPVTLHGSWHCPACAHGSTGAPQLAVNLEAASVLQQGARCGQEDPDGAPEWIMPLLSEPPPQATPCGDRQRAAAFAPARRHLFRRLLGRGIDEVARAAEAPEAEAIPEQAIRAGAYTLTEQRELLQIVCQRKDGQAFPAHPHEGLPLLQLTLQAGCTVCEACFRACPTGALRIEEDPGEWALTFQTDRCVACEVCREVCQPGALAARAEFDARPELPARVLHRLNKQRCTRCDRHFVSAAPEKTCPVCRDDEDAFSAIFG